MSFHARDFRPLPDHCVLRCREVQAVDNEFQINRQYDGARVMEILLRQAGNHPIGKFSWGNLVSLKEDPEKRNTNMHDVLEEFFNSQLSRVRELAAALYHPLPGKLYYCSITSTRQLTNR